MNFDVSQYQTRKDLERGVVKSVGKDVEKNSMADHTLFGMREDCRRLQLDDFKNVYGVQCVITDTPSDIKKQNAQSTKPIRMGKPKAHQIKR